VAVYDFDMFPDPACAFSPKAMLALKDQALQPQRVWDV